MSGTLNTVNGTMKTLMGHEICDDAARTKIGELESGKADKVHSHSAEDIAEGSISVEHGGTGGKTVAQARNNLGLGNTAGAVPVANGGTGAATAVEALHNLGIYWGTEEAPATGTPNTIYIQIN